MLDQLNTAVRHRTRVRGRGHFRVIHDFQPDKLSHEEVEALYALRCALAHDYSLSNLGRGSAELRPLLHHSFSLVEIAPDLIQLPTSDRRWNGVWGGPGPSSDHDSTTVGLRSVGDFVESLTSEIRAAHSRGEVAIACEGGATEMNERYFFRHNDLEVAEHVVSSEARSSGELDIRG